MARVQSNAIIGHCECQPDRRINSHPSERESGAGLTLSRCCSQKEWGHLLARCLQRWASAGQGRWLLYPGSYSFHIFNSVTVPHLQSNDLASQGLQEDLHFDLSANMKILQIQSCWVTSTPTNCHWTMSAASLLKLVLTVRQLTLNARPGQRTTYGFPLTNLHRLWWLCLQSSNFLQGGT